MNKQELECALSSMLGRLNRVELELGALRTAFISLAYGDRREYFRDQLVELHFPWGLARWLALWWPEILLPDDKRIKALIALEDL